MKQKDLLSEEWREIPGFDGRYEINKEGEVRSWAVRGSNEKGKRADTPKMLATYYNRGRHKALRVWLCDGSGKEVKKDVKILMRDVWMQGAIPGKIVSFKDKDAENCRLNNLYYTTQGKVNKIRHQGHRKPVVKCNKYGEIVEVYPSVEQAAKKNFISRKGLRNRIASRNLYDGFRFRYDR